MQDLQLCADERYQIVNAVREIVLAQKLEIDESIKYGGIVFFRENELIAGIFAYSKHISLELGRGFELDDKYEVLEGKGQYRRHIKLYEISDIDNKHVAYYVQAAFQ